jgi:hypothetical protein
VNIPAQIRAGDTVTWRDEATRDNLGRPIDGSNHGLTYYLRTNHNHQGATVAGVTVAGTPAGTGWTFTIAKATTDGFVAGEWYWQAVATATVGGAVTTIGAGQLTVLAGLDYTGQPSAFDGRTQAQKDLDAVQAAIRAIVSGGAVAEYSIGNRRLKKMEMTDLLTLESSLKTEVKREQKAALIANGLGNPHNLFVRF